MSIKLVITKHNRNYISQIVDENESYISLRNPMEYVIEFDNDNKPQFKYIPWQIISDDEYIQLSRNDIFTLATPKKDFAVVYKQIMQTFDIDMGNDNNTYTGKLEDGEIY